MGLRVKMESRCNLSHKSDKTVFAESAAPVAESVCERSGTNEDILHQDRSKSKKKKISGLNRKG